MFPLDGMMVIIHSIALAKKCCGWWPSSHQGVRCPKVISFLYTSINWLCHLNFLIEVWGGNGDKIFPPMSWLLDFLDVVMTSMVTKPIPIAWTTQKALVFCYKIRQSKHWLFSLLHAHQFFVAGLISTLLWKMSLRHPELWPFMARRTQISSLTLCRVRPAPKLFAARLSLSILTK